MTNSFNIKPLFTFYAIYQNILFCFIFVSLLKMKISLEIISYINEMKRATQFIIFQFINNRVGKYNCPFDMKTTFSLA